MLGIFFGALVVWTIAMVLAGRWLRKKGTEMQRGGKRAK